MRVKSGDIVEMQNGTVVYVTDAADPGDATGRYEIVNRDNDKVERFPEETIFTGMVYDMRLRGYSKNPQYVTSDMSEVIKVINSNTLNL